LQNEKKEVLQAYFIGGEIEWELSCLNFEEKGPLLDMHLTVKSGEQGAAWSNQWRLTNFETTTAIIRHVKLYSHTCKSRGQLTSSLGNQNPTFSPRMRGKNWNFEGLL